MVVIDECEAAPPLDDLFASRSCPRWTGESSLSSRRGTLSAGSGKATPQASEPPGAWTCDASSPKKLKSSCSSSGLQDRAPSTALFFSPGASRWHSSWPPIWDDASLSRAASAPRLEELTSVYREWLRDYLG